MLSNVAAGEFRQFLRRDAQAFGRTGGKDEVALLQAAFLAGLPFLERVDLRVHHRQHADRAGFVAVDRDGHELPLDALAVALELRAGRDGSRASAVAR